MPPNVLVLVFDTARADALEPYGASPGTTPALAQLAETGSAVPDVFATACWTLPSHASMFTGLLPRALGLGQAPGGVPQGARPVLERERERMLPEVLRRAGYSTRAVSTNLWVSRQAGFATGFDEFVDVTSRRQAEMDREDLRGRLSWQLEALRARVDDGAAEVEATLRRWLSEPAPEPFFWFVNLVECHSPYLPPRPYNDLGARDRLRAADEARRHLTLSAVWRACLGRFAVPDEALARMRHLYERSIRLLDDWLGRVLAALDERGLLDDTLVLVTSDHGENFGEDGLLAHAFSLDDRLIRVPLVSSRPDFAPGEGATSLGELPRMIAGYLGLADHPWGEDALPGGLAAAQWDFVEPEDPRIDTAAREWDLDEAARRRLGTPLTCVTDGRLKLLARGETRELYDLVSDPLEAEPRPAAGHPLDKALSDPALWTRGQAEPVPMAAAELAELESRMKLLGYM